MREERSCATIRMGTPARADRKGWGMRQEQWRSVQPGDKHDGGWESPPMDPVVMAGKPEWLGAPLLWVEAVLTLDVPAWEARHAQAHRGDQAPGWQAVCQQDALWRARAIIACLAPQALAGATMQAGRHLTEAREHGRKSGRVRQERVRARNAMIRQQYASGVRPAVVARRHALSHSQINRILRDQAENILTAGGLEG